MSTVRSILFSLLVITAISSLSTSIDRTSEVQRESREGSNGNWKGDDLNFNSPAMPARLDDHLETDGQRLDEISKFLRKSETGRWSLEVIQAYDISIRFKTGEGSRFEPSRNQVIIDENHDLRRAVLSIVHETTHAYYQHEGINADIILDDRQTYITKQIEEEVEAVANSIKAKVELEEEAIDMTEIRYPMEYPYRKAYEAAVEAARAEIGHLSASYLYMIGNGAGKEVLLKGYLHGKMWTSTSKESYPEYFGGHWDRVHIANS